MNSATRSLIDMLSRQPDVQHVTLFESRATDKRGFWQASVKRASLDGYRIACHDNPALALLEAFGPMQPQKRLPFVPRLKSQVRFWVYNLENGQTIRRRCEGTVVERFEKPELHSALCCVKVPGDKGSARWMSARFVMTVARKA